MEIWEEIMVLVVLEDAVDGPRAGLAMLARRWLLLVSENRRREQI